MMSGPVMWLLSAIGADAGSTDGDTITHKPITIFSIKTIMSKTLGNWLLRAPESLPNGKPPVTDALQVLEAGQHLVHGGADHHH